MKIALAQLNCRVGDFDASQKKIIKAINDAKREGADLIVFAEMAIGGYPAQDFWSSSGFVKACMDSAQEIARHCQDIGCVVGMPVVNDSGIGKPFFNAAALLFDGQIQAVAHKGLLPDYDVFNEYRYFEPSKDFSCLVFNGFKLAVTICEDLWNTPERPIYVQDPLEKLLQETPDVVINIAASPFAVGHLEERLGVLKMQAKRAGVPLFYVNQVGAHTDLIFDGASVVISGAGQVVAQLPEFEESLQIYDLAEVNDRIRPHTPDVDIQDIARVHGALVLGVGDFFRKSGFRKAILGLSGGLDSAVVAALACEALGPQNVMAVLMPSAYSSDHSLKDALDLVRNVDCKHEIIGIHPAIAAFEQILADAFGDRPPDLTEENIQARVRGTTLMAMSNKLGFILLNTSNKSEAAVGYGTLYGDMAGSLSVIGDVFKTQVYQLAHYINREREIIPVNTIIKPPSAELRPDQKDSDSLPDYDILDPILHAYIELEKDAQDIRTMAFDPAVVDHIIQLVDRSEFKRKQSPPVLRVSRKAFGPGRFMPLVAHKSEW